MEELKQVFTNFRDELWALIIDDVIWKTMMYKYFMDNQLLSLDYMIDPVNWLQGLLDVIGEWRSSLALTLG